MPRRGGPKPSHLRLVTAADTVPDATTCGAATTRGAACRRPAGWGTDHPGEGTCRDHGDAVRVGDCPFPLTGPQRLVWNSLAAHMSGLGLLKPMFWPTMYGLVLAVSRLHEADASIDEITVRGDNSAEKKHPASTIMNQMLTHVRTYSAELGITPSALAKIGGEPEKGLSEMEKLIRGR